MAAPAWTKRIWITSGHKEKGWGVSKESSQIRSSPCKTLKTEEEGGAAGRSHLHPHPKPFTVNDYSITELITATIMSCQKLRAHG